MRLHAQSHLRVLSSLIATAITAVLPGACGIVAGSPTDAGAPDGTESDVSAGSSSGGPDGSTSSGGSTSSSGVTGSSGSSASGSSSTGICPSSTQYPIDPALCELQLLREESGGCWVFEQPCFAEGGTGDASVTDGQASNPCDVCTTIVDGSSAEPVDASPTCTTVPTGNGQGLLITCGYCCIGGRAPRGFAPTRVASPNARATRLAQMAQVEAASVPAFHALHADLVRLRAPRRMLAAVRAAAKDEVRHARAVGRAATRFGARVPPTRVAPIAPRSLERLAIENAEEGCVRETFGAAIAAVQAERACDPDVRRMMRIIAREELRHAALAWDVASWLDSRLDAAERARVDGARRSALTKLQAEMSSADAGDAVLGWPDARTSRALLQRMWSALADGPARREPDAAG